MQRRERKKQQTRESILAAAASLFAKQGYQATTMEQVAQAADVGVGTLYNYFKTKDRLLLGVFADATEEVLASGESTVAHPDADPIEATCHLLETYERLGTLFEKPVTREMLAAALMQSSEEVAEFANLDQKLAAQVGQLLVALQERGAVAKDADIMAASMALYGALAIPLMLFWSVPPMSTDELNSLIRQQVTIVFRGLMPRTVKRVSK